MSGVRAQFGCPTGWLGAVVGVLMAIKNGERSEWVLSQLAIAPGERLLEVGYGPGVDVERAVAAGASVVGIDASDVMLRQASRRNSDAIREGRVDLRRGAMPHLPFGDRWFDKAYSINSYQFWPDKTRGLAELRRVVRPGGLVVVAVQPRSKDATNDTSNQTGAELVRMMTEAGFGSVKLLVKPMKPVATACVVATV